MAAHIVVCNKLGQPYREIVDAELTSFEYVLSDGGTAEFNYDPLAEGAEALRLGGAREVQIWLDDYHGGSDPAWWGVPLSRRGPVSKLSVSCEDVLWHLKTRIIDDASRTYTSVDQAFIFRDLIEYAQSEEPVDFGGPGQAFRDLNFTFDPSLLVPNPTGKIRSRKYKRFAHEDIFTLIKEFPTLDDGFDWTIRYEGNQRVFYIRYTPPNIVEEAFLGDRDPLIWEHGGQIGNIVGLNIAEEAGTIGTHGYVIGATSGDVTFEQNYEDLEASEEYGVRQFVINESSQKDVGWLHDRIVDEVGNRKQPVLVPEVTIPRINPDGVDALDAYFPGDLCAVRIDHGSLQYDGMFRIGKTKYNHATSTVSLSWAS